MQQRVPDPTEIGRVGGGSQTSGSHRGAANHLRGRDTYRRAVIEIMADQRHQLAGRKFA